MRVKMNHTKGEWKFNGRDIIVGQNIGQQRICTLIEHRLEYKTEDMANACLIAAAPDLLEACKEILECLPAYYSSYAGVIRRAKAAIAKAESEDQMKTTKLIEIRQTRLNRLYLQGSITKTELRDMLRDYAQFIIGYFGE